MSRDTEFKCALKTSRIDPTFEFIKGNIVLKACARMRNVSRHILALKMSSGNAYSSRMNVYLLTSISASDVVSSYLSRRH